MFSSSILAAPMSWTITTKAVGYYSLPMVKAGDTVSVSVTTSAPDFFESLEGELITIRANGLALNVALGESASSQFVAQEDAPLINFGSFNDYDEWATLVIQVTSNKPLIDPKNSGTQKKCSTAGDPITLGTGNKYQIETDYRGSGPMPLDFTRIYNALSTPGSHLIGAQWRHEYSRSVTLGVISGVQTALVTRDDGKIFTFTMQNGKWISDADVTGRLQVTGLGITYTTADDVVETYAISGILSSIVNREGQSQILRYDSNNRLFSVESSLGGALSFSYDALDRISIMTDPAGKNYTYAYDANGNLSTVTYPDGKVRTYLYGESAYVSIAPVTGVSYIHSLTGLIDENGNRYATWTYDSQGRALSSVLAGGAESAKLFFNADGTVVVTDANGTNRLYTFQNNFGKIDVSGISAPGCACGNMSTAISYDANGNVASSTDFNGNKTIYSYDLARNLETSHTEAFGTPLARTVSTTWSPFFRLPLVIAEPLRITTYTYDTKGNVLTKTVQPTADASGAQGFNAVAAGTPRVETYTYNSIGQVLTVDGPRTDVVDITKYTYDVQGNLIGVTNALNQITTLSGYDANHRPGIITDPNGLVTSLTYDTRGRLVRQVVGGEITSYTYDGVGDLINVVFPSGAAYTYIYDAAHRIIQIVNARGEKLVYTLDNADNRIKESLYDSAGSLIQTRGHIFDALNHLVRDVGAVNQTTLYTYDNNGNTLTITDPLNRLTSKSYDALNRLSKVIHPDNGVVQYTYDEQDQLTGVTDPRTLVTQYTRDGLGNLTGVLSPDTGKTSVVYDAAGNMISRTDSKGQVVKFTYDALNRIVSINYVGIPSQNVTYQYDQGVNGIGHLAGITDLTGTTSYGYDQHGRLTAETAQAYGAVYLTTYTYDSQGRLNSITYPSGRMVNYTFDVMGSINQISTTWSGKSQALISNIVYQPFGGVRSFTFGDGLTAPLQSYTRQHDQDGRIASYTLNGKALSIGYDLASQITFISDPLNLANTANYSYDPLSRLKGYTQNTLNQSYNYDVDGNRLSQTLGSTTSNYNYVPGSNRLAGIQTGGGTQALIQDANGATTSDASRQYGYDARGRLIKATTAQGVINYEVNALGLRVRKQVPYANSDTVYHYDLRGHLIDENPKGTNQYIHEYIWLDDQPVAVMQ